MLYLPSVLRYRSGAGRTTRSTVTCGSPPGERTGATAPTVSMLLAGKVTESLPFDVFHENRAPDFATQTPHLADAHRTQHLEQLRMPGGHQVHHSLRRIGRLE